MELKKLKCPECGANFESDEKVSFCCHCGAKLFFDDGTKTVNYNYNYKTEDVAKIREIEVNRELELNKRQEESCSQKKVGLCMILFFVIFIIGFCFLFMGIKKGSDSQEKELQSIVNKFILILTLVIMNQHLLKQNRYTIQQIGHTKSKKNGMTQENP